ncbi:MAG TPA: divergent polysaccharide deacetylase family protein [Smithellaceae bacterium]|nr:divergent polysaccharide deacetylase family protein [Smithellaceae bacterium]
MKKKKIQKTTTVLITLIVLAVAAIAAIVLWDREETTGVKPPHLPKEQAEGLREAAKAQRHKTEDGAQLARIAPPRSAARQVAIVIDDIGYDMKPVRELLAINENITFAVLPLLAHSREAAETLHRAHREILLHLPMEPLSYPKEKPGRGALFTDMNDEEILFQLQRNMDSVPYASGVNNHMGSKFMADEEKLTLVFRELKKKNLFFIDSRTTRDSKTEAAAHKARLTVMSRKIFLDNERDTSKIYQILMEAARSSDGNSPLIVIGHPYPETIQAVREAGKVCREQGITIVPVSALLGKQGAS